MNSRKVKAFTIMEVVITMILAALVIGITYTAYSIINKSYISYRRKNDELAVLLTLDKLLKKDFLIADRITKNENMIEFKFGNDSSTYNIQPDFVIRTFGIIDTFKVKTKTVIAYFEGMPIIDLNPAEEQNRIDELNLTLLYEGEKIPYHYYKQYSSFNLIQRNPNAVN